MDNLDPLACQELQVHQELEATLVSQGPMVHQDYLALQVLQVQLEILETLEQWVQVDLQVQLDQRETQDQKACQVF